MSLSPAKAAVELEVRSETLTLPPASLHDNNPNVETNGVVVQQLKPADEGLAAWRMLIVAFVFEALLWGKQDIPGISISDDYASTYHAFLQASRCLLVSFWNIIPHYQSL